MGPGLWRRGLERRLRLAARRGQRAQAGGRLHADQRGHAEDHPGQRLPPGGRARQSFPTGRLAGLSDPIREVQVRAMACVSAECPHPMRCLAEWRCLNPMTVSDKMLLDRVFEIRRQNNIPWRRLMELALQHAPEEAKAALREIADNDVQVAAGIRDLAT